MSIRKSTDDFEPRFEFRRSVENLPNQELALPDPPNPRLRRQGRFGKVVQQDQEHASALWADYQIALERVASQRAFNRSELIGVMDVARSLMHIERTLGYFDQSSRMATAMGDLAARSAASMIDSHEERGSVQHALSLALQQRRRVFDL